MQHRSPKGNSIYYVEPSKSKRCIERLVVRYNYKRFETHKNMLSALPVPYCLHRFGSAEFQMWGKWGGMRGISTTPAAMREIYYNMDP